MNILYKLLLVWLVAFGVATIWVDKNTPTLQQIKNQKYAEAISWINESKALELKAKADQKEYLAKKQKIEQWLYNCFNFETDQRKMIDDISWFKIVDNDECMTSWDICYVKWFRLCTLND